MQARALAALGVVVLLAACGPDVTIPTPTEETPPPAGDLAPLYLMEKGEGVQGQYIVVLREGAAGSAVSTGLGVKSLWNYASAMNGFAARLTAAELERVRRDPRVAYVEQDGIVRASATQSIPANGAWGLDRIDQTARGLSRTYTYAALGLNVYAYVIDTGIESRHPEFLAGTATRAINVFDAIGDGRKGEDCNGHGTHVAGTIGGKNVGVAKAVRLRGLRVLDCWGYGYNSDIIAALDWVRVNRIKPAVANLSLGGSFSKSVNQAVDRVVAAGVFVVVAAGNEDEYSCDVSPASALSAYTVAAADSSDARASFSNWGRCVSIYAPGVDILSAYLGGSYAYLNGTSMAAPHVAGVAALLLQLNPTIAPLSVTNWLNNSSTKNVVRFNDGTSYQYGTPNRLLFKSTL